MVPMPFLAVPEMFKMLVGRGVVRIGLEALIIVLGRCLSSV